MLHLGPRHTLTACALGYVTQAVVATLAPLLFITFGSSFGVTLEELSLLVFLSFAVQLIVDALSPLLMRRLSLRALAVAAHLFCTVGFLLLAVLPGRMAPFTGIMIAVLLYAVGGGLLEVVMSPLIEACPVRRKTTLMNLLHSAYSWGQVIVVLLTTAFFALVGIAWWRAACLLWAILPALNAVWFGLVPIYSLPEKRESRSAPRRTGPFLLLLTVIAAAGAAEAAIAQWASAFAEKGLGLTKSAGDLAGICLFAAAMGVARLLFGLKGERWNLRKVMLGGAAACAAGYLLTALSPWPWLSLAGCCLCGLSVGVLWPGTLTLAAKLVRGGKLMYAILALAGDVGCSVGPAAVGLLAQSRGDSLSFGLLIAAGFPLIAVVALIALRPLAKEKGV